MSDVAPQVLVEVRRRVAVVSLNRPERMNSWTHQMQGELVAALDGAAADPDVRAIVLTGSGRGFCAGADMEVLDAATTESEGSSRPLLEQMWCPKPVIAAINGACAGIGLQLALMSDVRFAYADAKLTTAFARRGLIAEHGITWLLSHITTMATAMDLLMSGRIFKGDEAHRLGIVHGVADTPEATLSAAVAYAQDLADNVSPTSMAVIKWQVYNHMDLGLMDAVDHADELMIASIDRPDLTEGVASFVQRRAPNFPPLDRRVVPLEKGEFMFKTDRQRN
jgi:enoyl-CoA hydratase/carnithine racemase